MPTPDDMPRVALVTGASSGIGRAVARALSGAGMTVCMVARGAAALQEAARDLPGPALVHPADVTDDAQVAALASRLRAGPGGVDVVVHSAAAYAQGPFESAPVADLDEQYRANLRAPYVLTQALLPQLRARRGQVVFINSTQGVTTRPHVAAYAATKHALRALADVLRQELGPDGIRVISVYPGKVATPMQERRYRTEGKTYRPAELIQPEDVAAVVLAAVTLPRTADVTDVHVRPRAG